MTGNSAGQWYTETGTVMGKADFLDVHFEALRNEYEQAVDLAGFEQGWHILDAGCGGGSFLPLLAAKAGRLGQLTAIDLDPENVRRVEARFGHGNLDCEFSSAVADLTDLPFEDNCFDAVWLANVLMYFTEEALPAVLTELQRVIRPGGLFVAKEGDAELLRCLPVPPAFRTPFYKMNLAIPGAYQARLHPFRFHQAGFIDVAAQTVFCERWFPLRPVERAYILDLFKSFASVAELLSMSTTEQEFWEQQVDPESTTCILDKPEFAYCAGHLLTTGRVPA